MYSRQAIKKKTWRKLIILWLYIMIIFISWILWAEQIEDVCTVHGLSERVYTPWQTPCYFMLKIWSNRRDPQSLKENVFVWTEIKKNPTNPKNINPVWLFKFFFHHCHFNANTLIAKMNPAALLKQLLSSTIKPLTVPWTKNSLCTLGNMIFHKLMKARFCLCKICWLK